MNAPVGASPLQCPACGAPQPVPPPDRRYVRCEHCGTTAFVSLGGLRRHLVTEPRLKPGDVAGEVRAFGAVATTDTRLRYHPFWEFSAGGRVLAVDAAPDQEPGLTPRPLASGERRAAGPEDAPRLEKPTLRPAAAAADASERLQVTVDVGNATLVHHPLFVMRLADAREIWVDGVEGGVIHGEVQGAAGVAFPVAAIVVGAGCGLLLPSPFSILGVLAVAMWPLRRYLGS